MPDWSDPVEIVKDAGKFYSLAAVKSPDTPQLALAPVCVSFGIAQLPWMNVVDDCRDISKTLSGDARCIHLGSDHPAAI